MSEKYDMTARLTINMVTEIIAKRHGLSLNDAISRFSKTNIYMILSDSKTELWMDNPSDIADMYDMEIQGIEIDPAYYFK